MSAPAVMPSWASRYVGVPWDHAGDEHHGARCWTLVRRVLAEQAGIKVPPFSYVDCADPAAIAEAIGGISRSPPWVAVAGARLPFDVVTMRGRTLADRRFECHCGIMITNMHLLQIELDTDSVIMPLAHPMVARRLAATYRHEQLLGRRVSAA